MVKVYDIERNDKVYEYVTLIYLLWNSVLLYIYRVLGIIPNVVELYCALGIVIDTQCNNNVHNLIL